MALLRPLLSHHTSLIFRLTQTATTTHLNRLSTTTSTTSPFTTILPSDLTTTAATTSPDEHMNDFLSRFVHKMKRKILDSYPSIDRNTRDGMLIVIADRVASRLRRSSPGRGELLGLDGPASSLAGDPSLNLSPHLWIAAWETSQSVLDDMHRARKRELMRRFLHSDDVKGMCHFAAEVGIRGNMLKEFRFKWAREEMEEWEFYRGLEDMRGSADLCDGDVPVHVGEIPERKGGIKYRIRGLDLSDPKWMEATEMVEDAENQIAEEEVKPLMGKSRILTERLVALDEDGDLEKGLKEWIEVVKPSRADWVALVDRIKDRSQLMYLKVAELLLDVESYHPTVRDYSRLLEIYSDTNRMEDAERIFQKMSERDIKPDIVTSIALVHMYSKSGNLKRVMEEFESLRKLGFQPNQKLYESIITANLKCGNAKNAELLMREMENHNMKPQKEIYMEILRAFSKNGHVDAAQRIVFTMQYAGISQTLESSTLLIEAYAQAGDPDQARNSFDLMLRSGQRPDDRSISGVVAAYEKKNLLDKALDFLLKLEKDGFKPGISTCSVLVDWLGRLLLVQEVEQIVEKITEKGDLPFDVHVGLCDMYARAGVEDKVKKSLKILLAKKELLKGVDFERIINGLLKGGFTQDAKRVNEAMQSQGLEPSETTKMALMTADIVPLRPKS